MNARRLFRADRLVALGLGLMGGLIPARAADAPAPEEREAPALVARTLPNGLEVLVFTDRSVPLVTAEFVVRLGSMFETSADHGLAHVYEHLFFRSNEATRAREEYLEEIDTLGITYNGHTREEHSSFFLTGLGEHLPVMLRFLRDAATRPVFAPTEISQEIAVVQAEIARAETNPYRWLNRRMIELLFPAHAAAKLPEGAAATVALVTAERLQTMHRNVVTPGNSALIVTGDCDPAAVFARAAELFGSWSRATANLPPVDVGPALAETQREISESANVGDIILSFAWRGPSVGTETGATFAADVLSFILRQPGSRLQRRLVDTGLASSVGVGYYTQRHAGPITFMLRCAPEQARAAVAAFRRELAELGSPGYFSDEEMEHAKFALALDELQEREKPTEYAHSVAFWWAVGGTPYLLSQQQAYRGTTRADIERYVRRFLTGQPGVALALVPAGTGEKGLLQREDLAP